MIFYSQEFDDESERANWKIKKGQLKLILELGRK